MPAAPVSCNELTTDFPIGRDSNIENSKEDKEIKINGRTYMRCCWLMTQMNPSHYGQVRNLALIC